MPPFEDSPGVALLLLVASFSPGFPVLMAVHVFLRHRSGAAQSFVEMHDSPSAPPAVVVALLFVLVVLVLAAPSVIVSRCALSPSAMRNVRSTGACPATSNVNLCGPGSTGTAKPSR